MEFSSLRTAVKEKAIFLSIINKRIAKNIDRGFNSVDMNFNDRIASDEKGSFVINPMPRADSMLKTNIMFRESNDHVLISILLGNKLIIVYF